MRTPTGRLETVGIGPDDTGARLITCVIAQVARHVTGIDITPAMIEQARARQQSKGLTNVAWQVGDVLPLPFAAGLVLGCLHPIFLSPLPRPQGSAGRDGAGLQAGRQGRRCGRIHDNPRAGGGIRSGGEAARPVAHAGPRSWMILPPFS